MCMCIQLWCKLCLTLFPRAHAQHTTHNMQHTHIHIYNRHLMIPPTYLIVRTCANRKNFRMTRGCERCTSPSYTCGGFEARFTKYGTRTQDALNLRETLSGITHDYMSVHDDMQSATPIAFLVYNIMFLVHAIVNTTCEFRDMSMSEVWTPTL